MSSTGWPISRGDIDNGHACRPRCAQAFCTFVFSLLGVFNFSGIHSTHFVMLFPLQLAPAGAAMLTCQVQVSSGIIVALHHF